MIYVVGSSIALIVGLVIFALLRKIAPSVNVYEHPQRPLSELKKEFKSWNTVSIFLFLFLIIVTGAAWWGFLILLNKLRFFWFADSIFIINAKYWVWGIPTMILSPFSSLYILDRISRSVLKEKYNEYICYKNVQEGMNIRKIDFFIFMAFGILAILLIILLLDWYILFTQEKIVINDFFSLNDKSYSYSEVVNIQTAPAFVNRMGEIVKRREYMIIFKDNKSWSTYQAPVDLTIKEKSAIGKIVSDKSGVPITELEVFKRNAI